MKEGLEISRETIRKILMEDLGRWKICASCVPHHLTDEQKAVRLQACQGFNQSMNDDLSLLDSIVADDETWFFQHDSQTERRNTEWRSPSSPRHNIFDYKSQKNKVILVVFFVSQGIIHKLFHQVRR
jgi:hypothetical protein